MPFDPGLADRVRSILSSQRGFLEKRMFGGVAFMIDGHMCCGVIRSDLMVRLSKEKAAEARQRPHTRPMDFTGRPMKSIVFVDAEGTDREEDLEAWVDLALKFVRTLPPKG